MINKRKQLHGSDHDHEPIGVGTRGVGGSTASLILCYILRSLQLSKTDIYITNY